MAHPSSPFLSADQLGLTLPDGRRLFGGLTLSFASERTGLVGVNGVGKSLLLDVLAGAIAPTEGRVTARGRVVYVRQGGGRGTARAGETVADRLGIRSRLSALERILGGDAAPADLDIVGPDGWDLAERASAHMARMGLAHLPLSRAMRDVSGGEATRVGLVGALLAEPDLLLLDEPTNDLDAGARDELLRSLARWSGGLLVVSHDRALLRHVDRILELTPSGVREYGGGYDLFRSVRDAEAAAAETELAEAEAAKRRARGEAQRVRERQGRRAARGKRARSDGGVPKVLLNTMRNRSEVSTGRIGKVMEGVEEAATRRVQAARERVEEVAALRMDVAPSRVPTGKDMLLIEDLTYTPPGADAPLLRGVDLVLRGPERVALVGPNGSGKSTLLRLCVGKLVPDRGSVRTGVDPNEMAYLDQAVRVLTAGESVLGCFMAAHPAWDESHARHVLARYLFPGDAALAPVERLSGGERMRAGLACVLGGAVGPPLLLLDEPTNHLDLRSLEVVERAVAEFDGTLVVVSHDRDFLEAVGVDRVLELPGVRDLRA